MQTTGSNQHTRNRALLILFALFVGSLILIIYLFVQRHGVGDIYPNYSSLRSDQVGTKLLSDSLLKAGHTVTRNYRKLSKMKPEPQSTVFFIGLTRFDSSIFFQADSQFSLLSLPEQGSRLVLTLLPRRTAKTTDPPDEDGEEELSEEQQGEEQPSEPPEIDEQQESQEEQEREELLGNLVNVSTDLFENTGEEGDGFQAIAYGMLGDISLQIPWYSSMYFKDLAPEWRVVLSVRGMPVVIEKDLGSGSMVVATDSHFLSNEAIWHERNPYFLSWLIGGNHHVIFDEVHHGIQQRISVGRLIRDFNLYWVFLALLVPALLFVVRSSMPLLPPMEQPLTLGGRRAGRDQFTGLVNILRSHPPENLLEVCVSLWCKANQNWCEKHPEQTDEIQRIARGAKPQELQEKYTLITRLVQGRHSSIDNNSDRNRP